MWFSLILPYISWISVTEVLQSAFYIILSWSLLCSGSEGIYSRTSTLGCPFMLLGKAFVRAKPHTRGRLLSKGYWSWGAAHGHPRPSETDGQTTRRVFASTHPGNLCNPKECQQRPSIDPNYLNSSVCLAEWEDEHPQRESGEAAQSPTGPQLSSRPDPKDPRATAGQQTFPGWAVKDGAGPEQHQNTCRGAAG